MVEPKSEPIYPGKCCLNLLDKPQLLYTLLSALILDVGSSDLLSEPQAKKVKMGVINVDSDDVQQALNTALDYPMFPLTLGAKKGSLKETLFANSIGFSSVKGRVVGSWHTSIIHKFLNFIQIK